jgi:hypothetical protein
LADQHAEVSQCNEQAHAASLQALPSCILSQIARNSGPSGRATDALLATARFGRDAVLCTCRAVSLDHYMEQPPGQATARLLHRACTQAHAGMKVRLLCRQGLAHPAEAWGGVESGGWDRVHSLKVRLRAVCVCASFGWLV